MKLSRALVVCLGMGLLGCAVRGPGQSPGSGSGSAVCIDADRDGYGHGCSPGHDCNDQDPAVHEGCLHCAQPEHGCPCDAGTQPVSCFLPKTEAADGTLMCHEGTRYCRGGAWSGCEGIHTYQLPAENALTSLVDSDAGPVQCNDCNVKCFVISDNLDPTDAGLDGSADGISYQDGGGITLSPNPDGGYYYPDGGVQDAGTITGPTGCVIGVGDDYDCDGVVDTFDPYPFAKPFATTNPGLFMELAPGETGEGTIELIFEMNTIDVYFLVDQTDSMQAVQRKLTSAMTTGTFLDSTVVCSDTDLDGQPNNELKNQGLLGGIRCLLRTSEFGTGFMREIPFSTYGHDDEITFKHLLDMGTDNAAAAAAIDSMRVDRDVDWPDAHPLALYSLVTGNGLYMGLDKPGVAPRVGCPGDRWGYACFRPEAIPVTVLFTDSPMHEGPPTLDRDFSYDPSRLTMTAGSQLAYQSVPSDNDTFATAFDAGDVSSSYISYAGSTSSMAADYSSTLLSCLPSTADVAPDATFTFALTQPTAFAFSTAGSAFSPAVALYNHVVDTPLQFTSDGTNEESSTALDLGDLADDWAQITGNTSAMQAHYTGAFVGCNADDMAADAVFKFSLSHSARVAVESAGSSFDTVMSLHADAPALVTQRSTDNTNETTSLPFDVGDAYQRIYQVTGGNTSAMTADYTETQLGCSADSASPDAVHRFALSEPARVRIDTVGSTFDTVVGLADGALGSRQPLTVPASADTQSTAFDVGDMVRGWYGLSGTTAGLMANYRESFIGCSADTFSPDAVMKFSLSQSTRVRLDTTGSGFDTVISLHDGEIDPTTPLTTNNTNEDASAPMTLGTVDDSWFEVFGGDTTLMQPDYDGASIGCGADTFSADAVFAFNVVNSTRVRIDTLESTFDTVISLHDAPPPINTHQNVAAGTEFIDIGSVNGASRVFHGSSVGRTVDYGGDAMGCGTDEEPSDVAFKFRVDTETDIEINTEGSTFDTAIGVFPATIMDPMRPSPTALDNTNETKATAAGLANLGTIGDAWYVRSGDTTSMTADLLGYCGAPDNARDAVIAFNIGSTRRVHLDTRKSEFDTVLALYDNSNNLVGCDDNGAGGTASALTLNLNAGNYYAIIKGARSNARGKYEFSLRSENIRNPIACNDDALPSGRSRLVLHLLPGDYHVVLKGARIGHEGDYVLRFRDNNWWNATHRLACDDSGGGGFVSLIERDLSPGTYYVVLKGDLAVDEGPFKLTVRSLTSTIATTHTVACNNNIDTTTTSSRLEADLAAGEYWVVVKGTAGQSGLYQLEMRDIGLTAQGLVLACDDDGGGGTASAIERNLTAGTYYAFVKGDLAGDSGAYTLNITDVSNTSSAQLACDDDAGGGVVSKIERDLTAGDYWVVLKGDAATDAGAYALSVRDVGAATRTQLACTTSGSGSVNLAAGMYDLVLKGADAAAAGSYTLTLGNGQTQQTTFDPPDWSTTLNQLQDRNMRVITVLNCHDSGLHGEGRDCNYARDQAKDLANATDAIGPDLAPLVVDIDANGNGIELAVMDQIKKLIGYMTMDVSARFVFEPDANPGFIVTIEAVDVAGDGCNGLIGLEHQNCTPGATPRFVVTITNPLANPVPPNPNDPNGGYHFRVDLIADGQYFVDAVPVYVIPEDVDADYPDPVPYYEPTGEYWQDVSSVNGCTGNERADWQDLFWTADVPDGTFVKFSVCTAETEEELETCAPIEVAALTGSGYCASNLDCPAGFCASNGVCQTIYSANCSNDAECSSTAVCDTSVSSCSYLGPPVYVGGLLGSTNLLTYLRMYIELGANLQDNLAPTVYDWSLTYICRNVN